MSSVVIVGPTGPGALESSYARAFISSGWEVHRWTASAALAGVVRGGRLGKLFATFVKVEAWERKANLELLALVDAVRPALLLVIDTGGVRAGTLGQIRARCPETRLYCVYPDSPHNLDVERIAALPLFDRIGTSSPAWVDVFTRIGGRHVEYLPFAADTTMHVRAEADDRFRADVCFVGTWRPEREKFLETFADLDLRIWGGEYWRTRTRRGSPLRRCWAGRRLLGSELGVLCASTRVMFNILDSPTWPGPNMRTFEQAACAAFSLTSRSAPTLDLFTEGESIECFDDKREARDKIDRYLADESARARVAEQGRRVVLARHTYAHRVATVLNWLRRDAAVLPASAR
jgi:spore maturation protein CgeB